MPSCTAPTVSKILVNCQATQPDMLPIFQVSGSGIATTPTSTWPGVRGGEQDERTRAVDQDVPDRSDQRGQALADRRSGLHDPVGDAAGEIVLEECPALPHHVPVVLPADHVADIGGDRLVGHDIL